MSENSKVYITARIKSEKSFVGQSGTFFTLITNSILSPDTILKDEITGYELRLITFIKEDNMEFYYLFSFLYWDFDDMMPNYDFFAKSLNLQQIQGTSVILEEGDENKNKYFDYIINFNFTDG